MIDYGLLVSVMVAFGAASVLSWRWSIAEEAPPEASDKPVDFLDLALGPALAGLAVGRLAALALDDPNSIGSLSDMLIIRSGVEFWPGVVAAALVVLWGERRAGLAPLTRLSLLVPLAMVGYSGYEAACVFRDGCFGPASPVGLRPPGVSTTMLPVGWLMAAAVVVGAVAVRALAERVAPRAAVVAAATAAVAGVRSVGSIWLPHVGDGLTRQHSTSIVVAAIAFAALAPIVAAVARSRRAGTVSASPGHAASPPAQR